MKHMPKLKIHGIKLQQINHWYLVVIFFTVIVTIFLYNSLFHPSTYTHIEARSYLHSIVTPSPLLHVHSVTNKTVEQEDEEENIFETSFVIRKLKTEDKIIITPSPVESKKCIEPKRKIALLKTHKTAGSTVANILRRYGYVRNLTFALPFKELDTYRYNYFGQPGDSLSEQNIIPKGEAFQYDILCNHVTYEEAAFRDVLPRDMFLFTIIREPFDQFVSTINYYGHAAYGYINDFLSKNTPNSVSAYLFSPWTFEPTSPYLSMTNNRMSIDLGLPVQQVRNGTFIKSYIKRLNQNFDLVLLREYFDESLILLKRHTCWTFKDLLYVKHNEWPIHMALNVTADDLQRHRRWNVADYILYDTFFNIFWDKIKVQDNFFKELLYFKKVIKKVTLFCSEGRQKSLTVGDSKWSPGFILTQDDCKLIRMGEKEFMKILHTRMMSSAFPKGYSFPKSTTIELDIEKADLFN